MAWRGCVGDAHACACMEVGGGDRVVRFYSRWKRNENAVDVAVKDPSGCHIAVAVDVQICKTRQLNSKAKSTKMDELVNLGHQGIAVVSGRRGKEVWTFQRQQGYMDPKRSKSAFEKIAGLMRAADKDSVRRFAETLKAKSKSVQELKGVLQVRGQVVPATLL